eukprot:Skav211301  [mRNA]  locus=scaffold1052:168696:172155:- [translate_table: standard]
MQEVEHESLDRFYKENEAPLVHGLRSQVKRAEQRKRFVQPRYYEGDDKTAWGCVAFQTDQVSSALRTDDGYLTKRELLAQGPRRRPLHGVSLRDAEGRAAAPRPVEPRALRRMRRSRRRARDAGDGTSPRRAKEGIEIGRKPADMNAVHICHL